MKYKWISCFGQLPWLTCVTSTLWEVKARGSLEAKSSRLAWSTWWNPVSTKNTKISRARWRVPVVPATQEAETRESPEPGRQRWQWAEIVPLHPSLMTELGFVKTKQNPQREQKESNKIAKTNKQKKIYIYICNIHTWKWTLSRIQNICILFVYFWSIN